VKEEGRGGRETRGDRGRDAGTIVGGGGSGAGGKTRARRAAKEDVEGVSWAVAGYEMAGWVAEVPPPSRTDGARRSRLALKVPGDYHNSTGRFNQKRESRRGGTQRCSLFRSLDFPAVAAAVVVPGPPGPLALGQLRHRDTRPNSARTFRYF
jgi:hypothetical protein